MTCKRETSARRVIFRICGNKSQPGLQLVEKLATPLYVQSCFFSYFIAYFFFVFHYGGAALVTDISEKRNE